MGIKIGSFNVLSFQAFRSDDEIRKDISLMAKIISDEKFDIIGIQEIYDEKPMSFLVNKLNGGLKGAFAKWEGKWGRPSSRSVKAAEGFAFIWNTETIALAESVTPAGKRIYEPRIYQQYRVDRKNGQVDLVRDPFYGRFKVKNQNLELRIINAHIMYDEGKSNNPLNLSENDMRRNEYEILVKNILAKESTRRYGNNLPAYTVLLGDYNLNLNRHHTSSPYLEEVIEIQDGHYTYRMRTVQDQLTTLKGRTKLEPDKPARGYANNYDHFTFDEERFAEFSPIATAIDAVNKYCLSDCQNDEEKEKVYETYKRSVSDHLPICLDLDLKR